MSGVQIELNLVVLFLIEGESFSIMSSIIRFFQCVIMLFFDFQFVHMVFLAMVNAIRRTVVFSFVMLIPDVSLCKQREREKPHFFTEPHNRIVSVSES